MAPLYDVYFATVTGTAVSVLQPVSIDTTVTPSSGAGNSGTILGDIALDTFTTGTNGAPDLYDGTVTFTDGTQGFVATYVGYTLVYLKSGSPPPTTAGTYTPDDPSVPMSEFDAATGTIVCFMQGTPVATPAGEVAVETLAPGDLVLTAGGAPAPVRWVGRRAVSRQFADPVRLLPVRIRAGALGDALPTQDLLVSPCHALLLDGVLVQAGALVNGGSIARMTDAPARFTYYHVELASHALVIVAGVPAETFIDNVDRVAFDNWGEHAAAGEAPMVEMDLPRAKSARQVARVTRERIATAMPAIAA